MISLVLADGNSTSRAGIRAILNAAQDMKIVGEAEDGITARELVERLHPKILLLEVKMPGLRSVELEKWVHVHCPETVTLILTAYDRDVYLAEMIGAGASGYLTANEPLERLIDAIRRAAHGEKLFTKEQYDRALNWQETVGKKWAKLTEREREVLKLLMKGLDNATIAGLLVIKPKTVALHVSNILSKLDVATRQGDGHCEDFELACGQPQAGNDEQDQRGGDQSKTGFSRRRHGCLVDPSGCENVPAPALSP